MSASGAESLKILVECLLSGLCTELQGAGHKSLAYPPHWAENVLDNCICICIVLYSFCTKAWHTHHIEPRTFLIIVSQLCIEYYYFACCNSKFKYHKVNGFCRAWSGRCLGDRTQNFNQFNQGCPFPLSISDPLEGLKYPPELGIQHKTCSTICRTPMHIYKIWRGWQGRRVVSRKVKIWPRMRLALSWGNNAFLRALPELLNPLPPVHSINGLNLASEPSRSPQNGSKNPEMDSNKSRAVEGVHFRGPWSIWGSLEGS